MNETVLVHDMEYIMLLKSTSVNGIKYRVASLPPLFPPRIPQPPSFPSLISPQPIPFILPFSHTSLPSFFSSFKLHCRFPSLVSPTALSLLLSLLLPFPLFLSLFPLFQSDSSISHFPSLPPPNNHSFGKKWLRY